VGLCLRRLSGISADNSWLGIDSMARNVLRSVPAGGRIVRNADSPVLKGFVLRYNRPLPLSWVKSAKFVCHMAGTMKFSEAPPYPYTCRSLRPTRTGKMRTNPSFAGAANAIAAFYRGCSRAFAAMQPMS
jgi:hypothetical protein